MTWNNPVIPAEEKLETKQLHVLGLWAPKTIRKAPNVEAFMTAFMDCVECHHGAYREGGVLHQDLRENSLMFEYGDHGHIRGVLNDWDLASCVDEHGAENEVSKAIAHRIGTIPFMARDLLVNDAPPPHLYRHNLELFFYILVWAAVNYNFGADEPRKIDPIIAQWEADTLDRAQDIKASFIANPSKKTSMIQRVLPTCTILVPWIRSLWWLFGKAQCHYIENYDKDWDRNTLGGHITFETFMEAIGGRVPR